MENLWEKNWPEHRRPSLKVQMKDSSKYTVTVIAKRQQRSGYKTRTPVMQVMAAVLSSLLGCSLCTTFVPSFTLEGVPDTAQLAPETVCAEPWGASKRSQIYSCNWVKQVSMWETSQGPENNIKWLLRLLHPLSQHSAFNYRSYHQDISNLAQFRKDCPRLGQTVPVKKWASGRRSMNVQPSCHTAQTSAQCETRPRDLQEIW